MVHLSPSIKLFVTLLLPLLLAFSYKAMANESSTARPCHQKSDAKNCSVDLPEEAIKNLKIDAGFGWGIFNGSIYNGNENYVITQLTITMIPIHGHHAMEMSTAKPYPKIHHINLDLPPLSKGAISMPLTGDDIHIHDFEWKVIKVSGYVEN
jgi:hypothetical protein